ncbi:hypothetical protein ACP70R_032219 [Stipagrostis hirtigluma subsp. patula]
MEAVKRAEMKPGEIQADVQGQALAAPVPVTMPEINQVEVAAKAQEDGVGSLTTPPLPLAAPDINQVLPTSLPTAPQPLGDQVKKAAAAGAAKGVCGSLMDFLLHPFQDCYDDACCDDSCCDFCY